MSNDKQFEWNDSLVGELTEWASSNDWTYLPSKNKWYNEEDENNITPITTVELMEKFKQSMPKQERIEVLLLDGVQHTFGQKAVRNFYNLETSKPIPTPLIPKIKQAIENALNPTTDTAEIKVEERERGWVRQSQPMTEADVTCPPKTYTTPYDTRQTCEHTDISPKEEELKDWEILTWFSTTDEVSTLISGGIEGNLKARYTIRSVRRISDGVVFSVGDKVNCDKCPESFSQQTIQKFIIADKGFMIASCAGVATSINNISKLPTPTEQTKSDVLFITEDGKSIRMGEEYWGVFINAPEKYIANKYCSTDPKNPKRFSTKEAVDKYLNKQIKQ